MNYAMTDFGIPTTEISAVNEIDITVRDHGDNAVAEYVGAGGYLWKFILTDRHGKFLSGSVDCLRTGWKCVLVVDEYMRCETQIVESWRGARELVR